MDFEELWVMSGSGLTFIHLLDESSKIKNRVEGMEIMIAGFLSALETIASDKINAIRMKKSKLLIMPGKYEGCPPFFIVGRVSLKKKDDKIRDILRKIRKGFYKDYKNKKASIIETF